MGQSGIRVNLDLKLIRSLDCSVQFSVIVILLKPVSCKLRSDCEAIILEMSRI